MGGRPARARGGGSGAGGGGLRLRAAQPTQAATKEAFPVMMHVLEPEVVSVPVLTDARVGMVGLEVEQEGEAVGGGGLGLAVLLALGAGALGAPPHALAEAAAAADSIGDVSAGAAMVADAADSLAYVSADAAVASVGTLTDGFLSAFLLIFFSEIGDKTFFIAVLLARAYNRPLPSST